MPDDKLSLDDFKHRIGRALGEHLGPRFNISGPGEGDHRLFVTDRWADSPDVLLTLTERSNERPPLTILDTYEELSTIRIALIAYEGQNNRDADACDGINDGMAELLRENAAKARALLDGGKLG